MWVMKLLLIEDDEYKAAQIQSFLDADGYTSDLKGSFQSGMRAIRGEEYDAILLDMSIPTFDVGGQNKGNRHRPFGGKDVLKELKRQNKNIPVVIVTQYSVFGEGRDNISLKQLEKELDEEFSGIYRGMVYFDASSADWISKLKMILEELQKNEI